MIRKRGRYYVLYTRHRPHRALGRHRTRSSAVRQERAIVLSQLRRQGRIPPRRRR